MNITLIKNLFKEYAYRFNDNKDYSLNLVGVRSNDNSPEKFNDIFYVFYKIDNKWFYHKFSCTTDPGVYWLKNPMNIKGAAILMPGQYRSAWVLGKHQGKYEALVQHKEVSIWRDNDKNSSVDTDKPTFTGIFGINIHRANANLESTLNKKWSAGCQVINNPTEFDILRNLCKLSGYRTFTYTLFTENQINKFKAAQTDIRR